MAKYRTNPMRQRMERGEIAVVATGPNSPDLCDFLGPFGFDGAFVDFEHGGVDWLRLADITRACRYPPEGCRGVAGTRRSYGVAVEGCFQRGNEAVRNKGTFVRTPLPGVHARLLRV